MGLARIWSLLSLVTLGLLLGAALTVPELADPVIGSSTATAVDREGRYLTAAVGAQLQDHRRAAETVAHDARLAKVFAMGELPFEARQSFMARALKEVAGDQPRFRLLVVATTGQVLASTLQGQDLQKQIAEGSAVKGALAGSVSTMGLSDGTWVVSAPLRDPEGSTMAAVALAAGGPGNLIIDAHQKGRFESVLLLLDKGELVGGAGPESDRKGLLKAAISPTADQKPESAMVNGTRYAVRRFTVGGISFALGGVQPQSVTVGLGDLVDRIKVSHPGTMMAVGIALSLWLIGLVIGLLSVRKGVGRLKTSLDEIAESPVVIDVDAPRLPGWLRSAGAAAQDALEAVKKGQPATEASAPVPDTQSAEKIEALEGEIATLKSELEAARKTAAKALSPALASDDHAPEGSMGMDVSLETQHSLPAMKIGPIPSRGTPISERAPEPLKRDIVLPAADEDPMPGLEDDAPDEAESTADKEVGPELREASIPGAPLPPELLSANVRNAARMPEPPPPLPPQADPDVQEIPEDEAERTAHSESPGQPLISGPLPDLPRVTEKTAIGPPPEMPEGRPNERHFRATYDEFIETRRACGEGTSLTYEKFRRKLMATRNQLFERFECEDVRFKVYVKNGKASLKATPVFNKPVTT
ncbi:MAG: MXAN_5187 C-terminal domain-containing protein [Bradymonadia bacterium]